MKTIATLLLATAASFALVNPAKAVEVVQSPRAQANQMTHVSGVNQDRNLAGGGYAGAGFKAYNTAHGMVASGGVKDINLVSGNYSAKSPFRDAGGWQAEIAPLIEKRDAGQK